MSAWTTINECLDNNGGCGGAICTNAVGTFACGTCMAGFVEVDGVCRWNNPRLASLEVDNASFTAPFAPGGSRYLLQTVRSTESVSLTPYLPAEGIGRASVAINNQVVSAGIPSAPYALLPGDNEVTVRVTAESGAVREYELLARRGWLFRNYIKASNAQEDDRFATSIALSSDGSTLAVGAPYEDSAAKGVGGDESNNDAKNSGAVYVFRRSGLKWTQEAYLKADNADVDDGFGGSVALSADGSTLVVGASGEDSKGTNVNSGLGGDNSVPGVGAAYVFKRHNNTWTQHAYLKPSNPDSAAGFVWGVPLTMGFGHEVAISGDATRIAVSAPGEASGSKGVGGSQVQEFERHTEAGAVYVFALASGSWAMDAYIKSPAPKPNAAFGADLALDFNGLLLVVGEPSSEVGPGVAHAYSRSGSLWKFDSSIAASNANEKDDFGASIALSQDGVTLAVGAYREDGGAKGLGAGPIEQADNSAAGAGAVYIYQRNDETWVQQLYVKPSNTRGGASFGVDVALSADGKTLAVGANGTDDSGILMADDSVVAEDSGTVYIFTKSAALWSERAMLKSPTAKFRQFFGSTLSLANSGELLAVGTRHDDGMAVGIDVEVAEGVTSQSGAVFIHE